MIVESIDLLLASGDEVNVTHFRRDTDPPSVVLAVSDGGRLALAEMTMNETGALGDALVRMHERGAEGGVRTG